MARLSPSSPLPPHLPSDADLDIECSKPFAPVLAGHRAVFSYKQGTNMSRGLVNALFASEARHPGNVIQGLTPWTSSGNCQRWREHTGASSCAIAACSLRCVCKHALTRSLARAAVSQVWLTVFDLLMNRSALGAAASTHVEVVRSTGPGLLREAILQLKGPPPPPEKDEQPAGGDGGEGGGTHAGDDTLASMGVALLDSSVWHPIMVAMH